MASREFEDRVVALLEQILATLKGGGGRESSSGARPAPGGVQPASDNDLDGEHGNPTVRKDPKGWSGDSFVGASFSECPPEYLDALAKYLAGLGHWMEEEAVRKEAADERAKLQRGARFKRMDASRAAGWARRLREQPPRRTVTREPQESHETDDIPF